MGDHRPHECEWARDLQGQPDRARVRKTTPRNTVSPVILERFREHLRYLKQIRPARTAESYILGVLAEADRHARFSTHRCDMQFFETHRLEFCTVINAISCNVC